MDEESYIQIYLTSKGTYTWTIKVPLRNGDLFDHSTRLLKTIDLKLKETFPNHAKFTTGTGRVSSRDMDPFD